MEYRCVATSVEGFVQQLAVAYITHGYWFYVTGTIPEGKDPAAVDAKLIEGYSIAISKWTRCRRKKQGLANMQYLRHGRFFVLLATKGEHEFFDRERQSIRDVRRVPVKFAGYSIGCRKGRDGRWHTSVRLDKAVCDELGARFLELVPRSTSRVLEWEFSRLPHQHYAPVLQQHRVLGRTLNRSRRRAGLTYVSVGTKRQGRRVMRPFEPHTGETT